MMPVFYYSYTKWVALSSKCTLTENHENQIMCDGKKLLSLFINANLTVNIQLFPFTSLSENSTPINFLREIKAKFITKPLITK